MRKWKRYIAHKNMEKQGFKHVNRHSRKNGHRENSWFSLNWREWVTV